MFVICINHNQLTMDGVKWRKCKQDVCEITRRLKKPTRVSQECPECLEGDQKKTQLLLDIA